VVIGIVKDRLREPDTAKGFLMDGFPRTIPQAEALDVALDDLDRAVTKTLVLLVDEDLLIRRLTGRRICRSCQTPFHVEFSRPKVEGVCDKCGGELYQRDDDSEATVRNRLEVYRNQTEPLIGYYDRVGVVARIDGAQEAEKTFADIRAALGPAGK
jgi:adenylate kinase